MPRLRISSCKPIWFEVVQQAGKELNQRNQFVIFFKIQRIHEVVGKRALPPLPGLGRVPGRDTGGFEGRGSLAGRDVGTRFVPRWWMCPRAGPCVYPQDPGHCAASSDHAPHQSPWPPPFTPQRWRGTGRRGLTSSGWAPPLHRGVLRWPGSSWHRPFPQLQGSAGCALGSVALVTSFPGTSTVICNPPGSVLRAHPLD